jgi:hypothetical protein
MGTVASLMIRLLAILSAVAYLSCAFPAQHANATPPGFPDLGGFAPVPVENYIVPPVKGPQFAHFSTPYNIQCLFEAGDAIPAWSGQGISCFGEIPGMGDGCVIGQAAAAGSGPAYALSQTGQACGGSYTQGNLLNVGQKVSFRNATCAVGADRLVACLDTTSGEHGFVLKPSGSQAF